MEKIEIPNSSLDFFSQFIHTHHAIQDTPTLCSGTLEALCTASNRKTGTFFLFDGKRNIYGRVCSTGHYPLHLDNSSEVSSTHSIPSFFQESPQIIIGLMGEHRGSTALPAHVQEQLGAWKADLCCSFHSQGKLLGFAVLGEPPEQNNLPERLVKLLEMLCQWTSLAIDNRTLAEQLNQTQTLVRHTNRLQSIEIIAGGFAHEIRNPLTSIKTFIQLAPERREDTEFICQFGHVVLEDVYRIERLIQEILDYARYMTPQLADEDLNDVVSSCLYFIAVKADSLSISIEKHFASSLPRASMDRQQIKQVLLNILLNALEAMADTKGSLRVETRKPVHSSGESWVEVEIQDTGVGIAPSNLGHIFEPFYSTKHQRGEHAGTGLGLVIAHQIIKEHRGTIHVESDVRKGSTFTITLPVDPIQQTGVVGTCTGGT